MRIVKCPNCGRTDAFVSHWADNTKSNIDRIEQSPDGEREAIISSQPEFDNGDDGEETWICAACFTKIDQYGEDDE